MNKPDVGDFVVFYPALVAGDRPLPCKGMVVHVWSDSCVNLACEDGTKPTSVFFRAEGSHQPPPSGYFCEPAAAEDPIELLIQAKGLTAPRVTNADVEAAIASEHYFTAAQGEVGAHLASLPATPIPGAHPALTQVTICVLILRNGTKMVGANEGPVSPENFDAELGRKLARQKAIDQIWPVLGYELRTRLHEAKLKDDCIRRCEA